VRLQLIADFGPIMGKPEVMPPGWQIAKEIVRQGKVSVPSSGRELVSLLNKQSPKNESNPVSLKE
jgi:hypothetical protein